MLKQYEKRNNRCRGESIMADIFLSYSIRLILTIVVIIILAFILFRFRAKKNATRSSLDVMKERLEKGEITEEDYRRAKEKQGKK